MATISPTIFPNTYSFNIILYFDSIDTDCFSEREGVYLTISAEGYVMVWCHVACKRQNVLLWIRSSVVYMRYWRSVGLHFVQSWTGLARTLSTGLCFQMYSHNQVPLKVWLNMLGDPGGKTKGNSYRHTAIACISTWPDQTDHQITCGISNNVFVFW